MKDWESNAGYRMEELLAVTAELADQYTSKESSSVTYETARMLMEAVLYSIRELETANALKGEELPSAREAYKMGYEKLLEKVQRAKESYEAIMEDFEDYGCQNYGDTLARGMPSFFLYYDPRFQPQNHLLTLDYPSMNTYGTQCGIDLIEAYLCDIQKEKQFLECFDPGAVRRLIKRTEDLLDISYMDNICFLVLFHAIGCLIADRQVLDLNLGKEDIEQVRLFFEGEGVDQIENKIRALVHLITERGKLSSAQSYLERQSHELALRISQLVR